jgi:cell division transport system permease protein
MEKSSQTSPKAAIAKARKRKKKHMRRKWITILRITRYGVANFSRNAWLTIAATVVMVLTLSIILTTFTASRVFNDTLQNIREKIDVSVYLCDKQVPKCKADTTDEQLIAIREAIQRVSIVTSIEYVTKSEALDKFIEDNKGDISQLAAIGALDGRNPLPASLRVHVSDTNKLGLINDVVSQDKFKDIQARPATTAGTRKDVLNRIAGVAQFATVAGLSGSALFVVISILIIFNTIRMAIFNRRDEIEIMKLIGAEKRFIRGPFIVEACLYGIIAALVSTALVYAALVFAGPSINAAGIDIAPTQAFFAQWPYAIIGVQIVVGMFIGVLSSLMAMRRYLKI